MVLHYYCVLLYIQRIIRCCRPGYHMVRCWHCFVRSASRGPIRAVSGCCFAAMCEAFRVAYRQSCVGAQVRHCAMKPSCGCRAGLYIFALLFVVVAPPLSVPCTTRHA